MGEPVRSKMLPWALLALASLALAWCYLGATITGRGEHEAKRWKNGSAATSSSAFDRLVRSPSQPGPLPAAAVDWSLPYVSVYSVPVPSRTRPTLRDLPDGTQAHAVDFLAKDSPTEPHPWTVLQAALSGERDGADPFRFDRVLVATVNKGTNWGPGDRMMWTRVLVQPINFSFAGYTVAATENATVKLSSVESSSVRKFSADLGLTVPGAEGPKASIGPSSESTVKSTAEISAQYEKLGIDIQPGFLRIVRESETGGDVLGNTTLQLTMLTDPKTILKVSPDDAEEPRDELVLRVTDTHLQDQEAADLSPADARVTVSPQNELPHCPLRARVWMLYERRAVDAGREYYDEARQDVRLLLDADGQSDVDVVEADDVSPAVWSLQIVPASGSGAADVAAPAFLRARVAEGEWREVVFTDFRQASKLAHWVRTHPGAPPVSKLTFDYKDGRSSIVPVKRTGDDCAPGMGDGKSKVLFRAGPGHG